VASVDRMAHRPLRTATGWATARDRPHVGMGLLNHTPCTPIPVFSPSLEIVIQKQILKYVLDTRQAQSESYIGTMLTC
jgi:hypothetical protein